MEDDLVAHSKGLVDVPDLIVQAIELTLGIFLEEKEILTILEAMERYGLAEMATMTRVQNIEFGEDQETAIDLQDIVFAARYFEDYTCYSMY